MAIEEGLDDPETCHLVGSNRGRPEARTHLPCFALGRALLGHGVGDKASIAAPAGRVIALDRCGSLASGGSLRRWGGAAVHTLPPCFLSRCQHSLYPQA